ncbi:DegV family protein [Coriobacteriia bacterium Es71-Z0120]|uniref:DegV family protein n=1 Tax=Parvivirga hydrogeniphila TaxID=2939460 RepID=UPI0022608552|nr:DegV family protein [Parvivirga hydrogeniphila]MCL4078919.1 DegV family protein [Parvivirga hydrogeniphila]
MEDRAVGIVTDSTSDITPQIAERFDIEVVPLSVTVGGRTFKDGSVSQKEFFELMAHAPELPTTSQPSVGAFVEAYERVLARYPEVVSVHISSALSGTVESAREAAKRFAGRVHVFDTRNLAWGEALQVLEAARAASAGASAPRVLQVLEEARAKAKMIVGLDKLDNLAKGGRIGKVAALLGGLLDLKVMISPGVDGAFEAVGRARGTRAALDKTLAWVGQQMGERTKGVFAVMHAMSEDKARYLVERIFERYEVEEMHVVEAGPVITAHTGTGWGVALLPRG